MRLLSAFAASHSTHSRRLSHQSRSATTCWVQGFYRNESSSLLDHNIRLAQNAIMHSRSRPRAGVAMTMAAPRRRPCAARELPPANRQRWRPRSPAAGRARRARRLSIAGPSHPCVVAYAAIAIVDSRCYSQNCGFVPTYAANHLQDSNGKERTCDQECEVRWRRLLCCAGRGEGERDSAASIE